MPSAYLWCPAYPLEHDAQLQAARRGAQALAQACSLDVVESPFLTRFGPIGAWGTIAERCADLQRGCGHDILLAARGGYGCIDLLDVLNGSKRLPRLIGYSDLTILHSVWQQRGLTSLYGFMPAISGGPIALATTIALFKRESLQLDASAYPQVQVLREGAASGPCFAACVRVLTGLVGTPAMPRLSGTILALEDIDERPYRLDRDLSQLWLAGALQGVRALIFGSMPASLPAGYQGPSAVSVATRWADRLQVPAIFGVPFGHEADPVTLPCGHATTLSCSAGQWRLQFAPAVNG